MSAAKQLAASSIDNIEQLLRDMLVGDYADNEVSLGVLQDGKEEIQIQLRVTRTPSEFIDTDYDDWDDCFKLLDEHLKLG